MWEVRRNTVAAKVNWQFELPCAEVKLSSLYPMFTTASEWSCCNAKINVPIRRDKDEYSVKVVLTVGNYAEKSLFLNCK